MSNGEENNLTSGDDSDIMLTEDEKRIIRNLRRYAKMYPFSDLAVLLTVHNGEMVRGTLCLGKNTTIKI